MIRMNSRMLDLQIGQKSSKESVGTKAIVNGIMEKMKVIHNCIVYDKRGTMHEANIDLQRILLRCQDLTGYEAGCNEFRFSVEEIAFDQIPFLAKGLGCALRNKFPKRTFVIIISLCDGFLTLRFHTYRANEGMWIGSNLEEYPEPVYCEITL